jgi:hypothetical protein
MNIHFKRTLLAATLAAILITAVAGPAAAHHSSAPLTQRKQKTITGTVKKVEWTNPHIWIISTCLMTRWRHRYLQLRRDESKLSRTPD